MLSRFTPMDPFENHPGLREKVTRALRSVKQRSVSLTAEEASFLIQEGGGPDPDRQVPMQSFMWKEASGLKAIVVVGDENPRCWRL